MGTVGSPTSPASALQYAQALFEIQSNADLQGLTAYLDPSEFKAGTNEGAFLLTDYANHQLVLYHPLYTGGTQYGTLTSQNLSPAARARLAGFLRANAPAGHTLAMPGLAELSIDSGLTLIIIGAAEIIGAAALTYFTGGAGAVWAGYLFRVGLATIALGAVVEAAGGLTGDVNSFLNPQIVAHNTSADGTQCNTITSPVSGCVVVCLHPDGTTTSTSCGGGLQGIGNGLIWAAVGIGVVGAVLIGGYVAYRYVSNRPRPGFGNEPSRSAAAYRATIGRLTVPPPPPPPPPPST